MASTMDALYICRASEFDVDSARMREYPPPAKGCGGVMRRSSFPLLLIAPLLWWGCAPRTGQGFTEPGPISRPVVQTAPAQRMESAQGPAGDDLGQSSSNQSQIADPSAPRIESASPSGADAHGQLSSNSAQPAGPSGKIQSAPALPAAAAGTAESARSSTAATAAAAPAPASQASAAQAQPGMPAKASPSAPPTSAAASGSAAGSTAAPAAPAAPTSATDERLAAAQKKIARLEQQLKLEVQRRHDVEGEMGRLLQETSAGPFEHADDVVEKHLREELDRAH